MKNKTLPILLTIICLLSSILISCAGNIDSSGTMPEKEIIRAGKRIEPFEGMRKIAENEFLVLYLNGETTEIAVEEKASGNMWYSNPQNRDEDPLASGINKSKLGSQLSINYFNVTSQQMTMDNYTDSISKNQFELFEIENGVRVVYTLGTIEEIIVVPEIISRDRFEDLLERITDADERRTVSRRYKLLALEEIKSEEEKERLLGEYPTLAHGDIYRLDPGISGFILEEMSDIIQSAGYTVEDMNTDHAEHNVPQTEVENELFVIPVNYRLDGDNFVASIETSEIEYDDSFPLVSIRLLEYFGAADAQKEGYIFVPDGSGALIYLNNGKSQAQQFISPVYGADRGARGGDIGKLAHLPVFGLKENDRAFFAIIDDADAYASVVSNVSGRVNSYNSVCASFTTLAQDKLNLGSTTGNKTINVYQPRMYEGTLSVRYAFLSGSEADYMGMARYYQNYLVERGVLKPAAGKENLPFYLEVVGAIEKTRPVLGIPVTLLETLTTFDQAREIVEELHQNGVENISLKYSGWFNGGMRYTPPNRIKPQKQLGGVRGLIGLNNYLSDKGFEFYPSLSVEYIYKTGLFDGFNVRTHAIRFLDKDVGIVHDIDLATYLPVPGREERYLLSPGRIGWYVDKVINYFGKHGLENISLETIGENLTSDFNSKNFIDRQQSKQFIENEMSKIADCGIDAMVNGGNLYTLPYVKSVINMPMDSNFFVIADESIPFFQIVTRGFIEYAGQPLNLAVDFEREVLKTIETGGGLYFKLIYEENSLVKRTAYDYLYSVNYLDWLDKAISLYNDANSVLGDVQGQKIINHQRLDTDVYQVTFEKGKSIIVNYNDNPVQINGVTIYAKDYHVLEGVQGNEN